MDENNQKEKGGMKQVSRNILRLVVCLLLIAAGMAAARFLIATKPKVNRRPPEKMAPLVKVMTLQPETYRITVPAMGTVTPAREMGLKIPVSGEVVYMHPELTEGGMLEAGMKILEVDPKDYELAVQRKKKALADAEYAFKLEQGHQDVARREWELLYGSGSGAREESDLALRRPHLEKVKAEMEAARAELEQARIDLARTSLAAPFNALVVESHVELGSQVSSQERLADLVGTDAYRVNVSLPVERLKWIEIPDNGEKSGSMVRVIYREDNIREGRVIRLLPGLSKEGRMARLLIEVDDPLGIKAEDKRPGESMLLLGEYVRVQIEGETLHDVYRIPRPALRSDREVWVMDAEQKLAIRPVETIWRDEGSVVVQNGFSPGELLVVSDIGAPVAGMALKVDQEGAGEQQPGR